MKRKTTKEILAESFLELAQKKRIDKITITDITDNCGMSQPTFYNHFKDKYDLIVWIYTSRVSKSWTGSTIKTIFGKILCLTERDIMPKTVNLSKML